MAWLTLRGVHTPMGMYSWYRVPYIVEHATYVLQMPMQGQHTAVLVPAGLAKKKEEQNLK